MRRIRFTILSSSVAVLLASSLWAQGNSRGTSRMMIGGKSVSVEYGRPALKGRTVEQLLDRLKPDQVWRLGADQSTTFSAATDLVFGDVAVPKGEYSLWARREADNTWKLVFNKQHGQWGTEHDPAQDLYVVPLEETKAPDAAEKVTLTLKKEGNGGGLTIQWGVMKLSTSFKAK